MLDKIELDKVISLAKQAGDVIMDVYQKDFEVEYKGDESPLTEADKTANQVIESGLNEMGKEMGLAIPILSEEGKNIPFEDRQDWELYWLVDPLDGTKEFVKKNGEFTVNIALMHHALPVLGVVYAPALGITYAAKKGEGAYKDGVKLPIENDGDQQSYKIVASRSHMSDETKQFVDAIKTDREKELISIGSSLKICLVAEGKADIYPRLGPTMEWDTGAAHAIVNEAGMQLMKYSFESGYEPHLYNKPNLLNSWFVVGKLM